MRREEKKVLNSKRTHTSELSEYSTGPKQSTFQRFLFIALVISLAPFVSPLGWIIADYVILKAQMPLSVQPQKEDVNEQREPVPLEAHASLNPIKVEAPDHGSKVLTNSGQRQGPTQFLEVEGSQGNLSPFVHSKTGTDNNLKHLIDEPLCDQQNKADPFKTGTPHLREFFKNQRSRLGTIPSIWPVRGQLSSGFGYRRSPFSGEKEFHKGLDIAAEMNTPIVASANGIVSAIGRDRLSGRTLCVNHGDGIETIYAHLQEIIVKKGQHVKCGDTVALVGNTGRSTGPHLHYAVLLKGVPVNPINYIADELPSLGSTHPKAYPYALHLGSFRTLGLAKRAVSIYTKKGLSPYWTLVDLKEKGLWYRIFAGYFSDRKEAERFKERHRLEEASVKKTVYANLVGTSEFSNELEEIVPALEDLGYYPYLIKGDGGRFRLLVGAFYSKAGAETKCLELRSKGFAIQVVKR